MGALYIKDERTAFLAERVATKLGTTKTEAVRQALEQLEASIKPEMAGAKLSTVELVRELHKKYAIPEKLGPVPDKTFYDELSGDL